MKKDKNIQKYFDENPIEKNQNISIIRDFEIVLQYITDNKAFVTKSNQGFESKIAREINKLLTFKTNIEGNNTVRAYSYVAGLYLIMRTSGLVKLTQINKKLALVVKEKELVKWKELHETEKYFTLLKAWWIDGNFQIIGIFGSGNYETSILLEMLHKELNKTYIFGKNKGSDDTITIYPGLCNFALARMFGLIEIVDIQESEKKWIINEISRTELGYYLSDVFIDFDNIDTTFLLRCQFTEYTDNKLINRFNPYIPNLRKLLILSNQENRDGLFIFSIKLHKAIRKIAIPSTCTLDSFCDFIIDCYDFDHDHLYMIRYQDVKSKVREINSPHEDSEITTEDIKISNFSIEIGQYFEFIYDFGDNWEFECWLEEIKPLDKRIKKPQLLESKGKSPEQYPDYDEDFDDEEEEDEDN